MLVLSTFPLSPSEPNKMPALGITRALQMLVQAYKGKAPQLYTETKQLCSCRLPLFLRESSHLQGR